jgi:hypothetical protein
MTIRPFCEVSDLKGPLNAEWETERHFAINIQRGG